MRAMGRAEALNIGLSPSVAMGVTYLATADSLSLAMANAAANQQRGQALTGAAVARVLALIVEAGATRAATVSPPKRTVSRGGNHE